tara:strand:- start:653 stop:766 length:114 start_codon:yes stop_codon:yes gene_type:complete
MMDAIIILGFIAVFVVVYIKRKKPELYESLKSKLKLK